jgi:hypothetical protein
MNSGCAHYMLEKFLRQLCNELSISPIPQQNKEKIYLLPFNDTIAAKFMDLEPGISVSSNICDCPKKNREDIFIWIMRANLLGQGTGSCRIGLSSDEKVLTLSLGLPYEINYPTFKEKFEDFINYVIYWREEIAKFEGPGTR